MKPENHKQAKLLEPMVLSDLPDGFSPNYSPMRMLKLGVFGGNYFAEAQDPGDYTYFTAGLYRRAKQNDKPFAKTHNCFGTDAGLSYDEWDKRGWIFEEDPLGWFHWYCRFYCGRRHERDAHQIDRWQRYEQRWGDRALNGDPSATVMQGLLQWGIDPWMRHR